MIAGLRQRWLDNHTAQPWPLAFPFLCCLDRTLTRTVQQAGGVPANETYAEFERELMAEFTKVQEATELATRLSDDEDEQEDEDEDNGIGGGGGGGGGGDHHHDSHQGNEGNEGKKERGEYDHAAGGVDDDDSEASQRSARRRRRQKERDDVLNDK